MLITTNNFRKACDFCVDPLYYTSEESFTANIPCGQNNKSIFINTRYYETLVPILAQNQNMKVVLHGCGRPLTAQMFEAIKPFASHVYALNCEFDHSMVTKIPLGLPDTSDDSNDVGEKTNLCYLNIGLYTDDVKFFNCRVIRIHCVEAFKDKPWVTRDTEKLPIEDFIKKLSTFKFCICPTGTGLDTHRVYEAAKVGCRPIVVTSPLDVIYKKFGALIVDDWSDVTQELLESQPEYTVDSEIFECDYWLNSAKNSSNDE